MTNVPPVGGQSGEQLIDRVVSLTGLPEELLKTELDQLLTLTGHDREDLTLDELRSALLAYLDGVQPELLSSSLDLSSH